MAGKAQFGKLFEPGKVGTLELKNRVVMAAMGTRLCGVWGEVTDPLIDWYRRRSQGGCGLIIVEATYSATAIDNVRPLPRNMRADDTCYIPGLATLVEVIHRNGAKAAIQLSAGAGAQAKAGGWLPGFQAVQEMRPVSPSGVPGYARSNQPRVLTIAEIEKIVELMGRAAWNVKQAGFDLIEIHGHAGYLISEFLSPYFNKRTDHYGGSLDNRCRFLLEIVDAMRKTVGADFPLTVKYSIEDSLPGGWDIKQSQILAKKLEEAGVNGIAISSGVHFQPKMPSIPPYFCPRGIFVPYAEAIKEAVSIPVFVVGRLDDPQLADKVLREGKGDFICLGRGLIADPDWPKKVASGEAVEVRPCLACNECRESMMRQRTTTCAINAAAAMEQRYDVITPAQVKKRVMVVGGGPAGMEAARISALRGHAVTLCEQHKQLGGLTLLGGIHNEQITAFAEWLVAQIKKLPVEVRLQTEVTPALVEEIKPDAVILATGGTFVKPAIPGIDKHNVFSAQDLLNLMNGASGGKSVLLRSLSPLAGRLVNASMVRRLLSSKLPIMTSVAIIGGQFAGCSLALFLAQSGKKVVVLEPSDKFGGDLEEFSVATLKSYIEEGNVKMMTSVNINEITDKGVIVTDEKATQSLVEVGTVLMALELAPSEGDLAAQLKGKVNEIYTIGDARSFRRIKGAVSEGYAVAFSL